MPDLPAIREGSGQTDPRRVMRATAAVLVVVLSIHAVGAQDRRHVSGQTVTPSFEGWFKNSDGSFGLVFGYYNRNFEETIDVPIGPSNVIEPGPADQGQPTHFLPRRQVGVFAVRVPVDFGDKTVTWTLVTRGQRFSIPGYLRPEWQITPFEEPTDGQTPPQIRFAPTGAMAAGPFGTSTTLKTRAKESTPLTVWVEPGHPGAEPEPANASGELGTTLEWTKFRGDAAVQFDGPRPKVEGGIARTTVTFDRAGRYRLRLLAGSAQTRGCCWTNGYVDAVVE